MGRTVLRGLLGVGIVAATLATGANARAAGTVVVSASPPIVVVGQPLEILVRTFIPIQRGGTLDLSEPRAPYPGPSDLLNVLYPWGDYDFDVVARHEDGTEIPVVMERDPLDSTLWRGIAPLPRAGTWTVWVRNFSKDMPGATTVVTARAASLAGSERGSGSMPVGAAALVGLLVGLVGFAKARRLDPRRRARRSGRRAYLVGGGSRRS